MTADQVWSYVMSLCTAIWQSEEPEELDAYWRQLQQGPANLTGDLRRLEGALGKAGAARDALQETLKALRGQLALALNGPVAAAPVEQAVAAARRLTDAERAAIEQDLAQTTALRQDLEQRRGGRGTPSADERLLRQLEQDYLLRLADPIPQLDAFGQGLRGIAGATRDTNVTMLEDSIAKVTAAVAGRESEIGLLTKGVSEARAGLNIAKLTLKTVELNCYQPRKTELAGLTGDNDLQIPADAVILQGTWSADCGDGYTSAGGFRMVIAADGGVTGRYTSDLGELPVNGIMNVNGMLAGAATHPDGAIEWNGYLKRDAAIGTAAANGTLVFSGEGYTCNGAWNSQ